MKIILYVAVLVLLAAAGCRETAGEPFREIRRLMDEQAAAWNHGDVEGFMDAYWRSDSLLFVGSSGITRGWDATLERYRSRYPDRAAMGTLQFTTLGERMLSKDCAWTLGKWELMRDSDTLGGYFTLVWKNMDGRWYIISDHTS